MHMRRHMADIFVVLTLFFAYAASAVLLCAIGAGVYQRTADNMQENYDIRTGVLYIAEKVRQNDMADSLRIEEFEDNTALVFIEQRTGLNYETWVYIYEDQLCELLIASGMELKPSNGQVIMPMRAMSLNKEDSGLLRIALTDINGRDSSLDLYPKAFAKEEI